MCFLTRAVISEKYHIRGWWSSGAVTLTQVDSNGAGIGTEAHNYAQLGIDASRSNPIYGASATVQPPAISLIAQIKY